MAEAIPTRHRLTAFVLLAALALGSRLVHLDWGLPLVEEEAYPAKKALEMWGFGAGRVTLDPDTAGWPALSFYAQLALQHLQYGLGRLTGSYGDRLDYWLAWQTDPSAVILWGRVLSALLSTGIVLVGAAIGRRLAGGLGFWTAGLLLAVSPLLVRHAQLIDPDGWVGLFAALAVWRLVALAEEGRRRDYVWAGLWIGLGAAAKYTPALLAVSLYAVHLRRLPAEGRSLRLLGLDDRRLGLAALACVLAFVLATPYTLLDLGVLRRDVGWQAAHLGEGHFGHADQGLGWVHYLASVLPWALGWPALLLALYGLWRGIRDRRPGVTALILAFAPFLLVLGALGTHFDRYMIPALVPLAALAAVALADRTGPLRRPALLAAALLVLVGPPAGTAARLLQQQGLPSTRLLATAWVEANVDGRRQPLVSERYGPELRFDPASTWGRKPVFDRLSPAQREALLALPSHRHQVIPMYSTRAELAAWFYDLRRWTAYDVIVTSGGVRSRYEAEPGRFPAQAAFYAALDEHTVPLHRVEAAAGRGPEIRIHGLTPAGRARVHAELGALAPQAGLAEAYPPHVAAWADAASRHAEAAGRWAEALLPSQVAVLVAGPERLPAARQRLAVVLHQNGETAGAEAIFTELRDLPGYGVTALGYLGLIAEGRGETERARACYEELIARDPANPAADLARARLAALE